jgi:acyl-CoA hydrolase
MLFKTRKLIKPEDLNARGTLFGGQLLKWVDEEAAIFAICQLETTSIVTKLMSEINFIAPAFQGDIIEIGLEVVKLGKTSITLRCVVQNKNTKNTIIIVEEIVFVCVGEDGKSKPHGITIEK